MGEIDQKIAQYDQILADKDQQIAQLQDNLAKAQSDTTAKDQTIINQVDQLNQQVAEKQAKLDLLKDETIKQLENQLSIFKNHFQELPSQEKPVNPGKAQLAQA